MPETIAPPAPTTTPTPPPQQTPAQPDDAGGSQSFVSEIDDFLSQPPKPPEEPKAKEPAKPAEPKPGEQPPPTTPKPTQPLVPPETPKSLRARLAEIEKEYSGFKLTAKQEKEKLAAKIAEFEKRPYLTPEQIEQQSALEKKARDLEAELSSRDFSQSETFKKEFQAKVNVAYQAAIDEVAGINVTTPEGERASTPQDFRRILDTENPAQARQLAKEMFGEDYQVVLNHRTNINNLRAQARQAIADHKEKYEQTKNEMMAQRQREAQEMRTIAEKIEAEMEQKHAAYFGKHESDEEINNTLARGMEFVESSLRDDPDMPVQERVGRAVLIRRMAGSFPRVVLENKRLAEKLAQAEETISKLQGTDPGAGAEIPGGAQPKVKTDGGVDDMIKEFDLQQ